MTDLNTRKKQLGFFDGTYVIKQDQDLIDLIERNAYTRAVAIGDVGYFNDFIKIVGHDSKVDFCIYIENRKFKFDQLANDINAIIQKNMNPGGLVYLSLNKYQAVPRCYDANLPKDYDQAIQEFFKNHINATIESYQPCMLDGGNRFNWVHPLTRFHFRINK